MSTNTLPDYSFSDDNNSELAALAIRAFPPVPGVMIREVMRVHQCPAQIPLMVGLHTMSASLRNKLWANACSKDHTPPNLMCLGLAGSGTGKTTISNPLIRAAVRHNQALVAHHSNTERPMILARLRLLKRRAETCARGIERGTEETGEPPRAASNNRRTIEFASSDDERLCSATQLEIEIATLTRLLEEPGVIVENTTSEALVKRLDRTGGYVNWLSMDAREPVKIVAGLYRKGQGDEKPLIAGYSGEPMDSIRVGRDRAISIPEVVLGVLWLVQPDLAPLLFRPGMTESGAIPRFLTIFADHEAVDEIPGVRIEPEIQNSWDQSVIRMTELTIRCPVGRVVLPAEPAAEARLAEFHNAIMVHTRNAGKWADIASYAKRWREQAIRICLSLCAYDRLERGQDPYSELPISDAVAERAITIMNFFIAEQLRVLTPLRATVLEKKITHILKKLHKNPEGLVFRDVSNLTHMPKAELQFWLAKAMAQGVVYASSDPKPLYFCAAEPTPTGGWIKKECD